MSFQIGLPDSNFFFYSFINFDQFLLYFVFSECRRYQYPVNIANSMVCQGVENSAPCQGDSGGPLIIRQGNQYVQFGLVSFGPGICNNGRIPNTVFTQVSYYLDWIENTIRQFENRDQCR